MSFWRYIKGKLLSEGKNTASYPAGASQGEKDTLTAIRELSRAVLDNPDALEIYQALGHLYRSRGDVERAVHIRASLLNRPELPAELRGLTYFELGQDYRRAGLLDRAAWAYREAGNLGFSTVRINSEMAALYAGAGDWEKACACFSAVGNKTAEAHFMVRQGAELLRRDKKESRRAMRLFVRALKIFPPSVEAWTAVISERCLEENWKSATRDLDKALNKIPEQKSFMLFEELLRLEAPPANGSPDAPEGETENFYTRMTNALIPALEKRPPEIFPNFYGARLLQRSGRLEEAEQWLDKALVMQPDFWYGRLLRLELACRRTTLPSPTDTDLAFFISRSSGVKHFVCSACGLHREQLFYCCQRCNSWHSATYKFVLND